MSVYLLATLDTKGAEAQFLREQLVAQGAHVILVDVGCLGDPQALADVPREAIFAAAGTSLAAARQQADRGAAVTWAATGAARLVRQHFDQGRVAGVLGMGGSAGTTIATAAMRALPVGVPKLAVSTLASGQVRHYVGDKDLLMLNSIVDIAGLNRVTRTILRNAAAAMAGMVTASARAAPGPASESRPLIAATMFGVTTPCVERARQVLEEAGFEVLVFHATGAGGQAMESLVADGLIAGVLDITTTELADELVGGVLSAGPARLTAAGAAGVPQVVSVGATDMVNFHTRDSVPQRFRHRLLHQHNASVTLMRTNAEENRALGADMAHKLRAAQGPVAVLLPRRGVSALDQAGAPFDDPAAREALFAALRAEAGDVPIIELDFHINAPEFAEAAARRLIEMIRSPQS